ncbi:MAG: hypothetical protein ACTSRS_05405 [Candidatus Helarchaeota archaeon]
MTLFIILFVAGLLCLLCAVLLAIYLLKSDRFTAPQHQGPDLSSYEKFEGEESRLARILGKIIRFFKSIKRKITRKTKNNFEKDQKASTKALNALYAVSEPSIADQEPKSDEDLLEQ